MDSNFCEFWALFFNDKFWKSGSKFYKSQKSELTWKFLNNHIVIHFNINWALNWSKTWIYPEKSWISKKLICHGTIGEMERRAQQELRKRITGAVKTTASLPPSSLPRLARNDIRLSVFPTHLLLEVSWDQTLKRNPEPDQKMTENLKGFSPFILLIRLNWIIHQICIENIFPEIITEIHGQRRILGNAYLKDSFVTF